MDNIQLEAIVRVLESKQILIDSFSVTENNPALNLSGGQAGLWERTFSITVTEILTPKDIRIANENKSGRFETVYEQIQNKIKEIENETGRYRI